MNRKNRLQQNNQVNAPPRSLYRKIQIVLSEARRGRANSVDALVEQIEHRGHVDFTRYKVDTDHTVHVVPCSKDSINRTVGICIELGLVDSSSGKLTRSGTRAADSSHFNEVMRQVLAHRLSDTGTPLQAIKGAITKLLSQGQDSTLPTWEAIYEYLDGPNTRGGKDQFRNYLSLLSACQGIPFSRKKIYLPNF